jgi:hypothetical protein
VSQCFSLASRYPSVARLILYENHLQVVNRGVPLINEFRLIFGLCDP